MKRFLKENIALVAGITLPLALMFLFFIAGQVTRATVPDPQYDMIFVTSYYTHPQNSAYQIKVKKGDLIIEYEEPDDNQHVYQVPSLYRFDHQTLESEVLDIDFNHIKDGKVVSPALDRVNRHDLLQSLTSPDGWEFDNSYRRGHSGFFGDLFGFGYGHRGGVLRKDGRVIDLDVPYSYNKTVLWLTGEKS